MNLRCCQCITLESKIQLAAIILLHAPPLLLLLPVLPTTCFKVACFHPEQLQDRGFSPKLWYLSKASATPKMILLSTVIFSDKKRAVDILIVLENTVLCCSNNIYNNSSRENSCHHCRRIKKGMTAYYPVATDQMQQSPVLFSNAWWAILHLIRCLTTQSMYHLSVFGYQRNIWILHPFWTRSTGMKYSFVIDILCPSGSMDLIQKEPVKNKCP